MSSLLDHREQVRERLEDLGLSCEDSGAGFGGWDLHFTGHSLNIDVSFGEGVYDLSWQPEDADEDADPERRTLPTEAALITTVTELLAAEPTSAP
ncbi:hypothetical protein [Deinococcus soli (ex Cha et al. 2016)]|uniref:hypothetical protein n=1 Tax=Deinococcus soli (ex Cha et al. 2016) TaxID=1309411 RepID=UPI0016632CDD|nr:hypothetical protein [Deinococcus soli (ex Cha et al. 2016)]GGB83358.1 hypothetical protein GCM10008019_44350 [Deinococcus soli (ex Cha et al. 2016)]